MVWWYANFKMFCYTLIKVTFSIRIYILYIYLISGEYLTNQCRSSHCLPCHIRHATCRGLPNGLHQWRGREMTSYFIVCQNERVIFHGRCQGSKPGQYMVFSTQLQSCVDRERAQMARQSNVKALQSLQLVNLPVDSKSNSTINSIAINLSGTATIYNGTKEMQHTEIILQQNQTHEYHQLNQTQFINQTSPIQVHNQTIATHQPSPSMLHPEPILQLPRPLQNHPVQNHTLEVPIYPEVTNQNLRIPPSAILIMTNKQDNNSVNNKDTTPRFSGINVISPQIFGFRTVQTPILVEATKSTNVNIGSNTHAMPNREVLQNAYNITQPLNTRSSIVRVVPNGWASFNSRSLIEIPSVLKPATNKPIVEIQPDYSHMGRRIDILPIPNIKNVMPITPIMVSHHLNNIEKKIQHVEQNIPNTGPFITQRQNHQAPFVQTNQPVTDVPYFQPVTTIEPIVNIPEMINIKPIHPAMMSRSQIRFPDHHTELLPNSIFNSISKEHASTISKNGLHVTNNKASGKGTNYLATEQNKTQLVSLLLDVLNIYKQKSQNSSVTANTNGVKLEKKNTITNGNNGKQVKEARMTPPPVNIKDIKSTEVLSMDVIPNKNVLSNKHIDNIERVVTQMQNTFDNSNSNNIMDVQNKQTGIVKSHARVVFLTPFKFSSKQKSHGGTVNTNRHTLSQSSTTQGNQQSNALNADPLRNAETNKPFQEINFKTIQSNFPNSILGVKASDAIKHKEVLPTRSSKLVNNHQYSDLIERLNFLGTSGRGRVPEASRLLPLATLKTANFVQRRKVLAQRKSNVPTSFTFSGINP